MKTRAAPIQRCACGKTHAQKLAPARGFEPAPVQRSAVAGGREFGAEQVHPGVLRPSSGGAPLPSAVQARMEAAFGHDFSNVRVHHGPEAESIGAVAFTRGTHLHFAPGRYQPHSIEGQRLIGHELAHVVQQRVGRVARPGGAVPINADPALEREADVAGARAAAGWVGEVTAAVEGVALPSASPRTQADSGPMQRMKSKRPSNPIKALSSSISSPKPSAFKKVRFNSSKGRFARKQRFRLPRKTSGVNFATAKFVKGKGTDREVIYVTRQSEPGKDHSEKFVLDARKDPKLKGFKLEWLFTEREPCGKGQGMRNCRQLLKKAKVDPKKVFYVSRYPDTEDFAGNKPEAKAGRKKGNKFLVGEVKAHKPGKDSETESEEEYGTL